MSPPPPKKQICANLQQLQQQQQQSTSPPHTAVVTPKANSIHSSSRSSFSSDSNPPKSPNKSTGAHSSTSLRTSTSKANSAPVSPAQPNSPNSSSVHKSPRSLYSAHDRLRCETTKDVLRSYEPISPASSSDAEDGCSGKEDHRNRSPLPTRCDYVNVIVRSDSQVDGKTVAAAASATAVPAPTHDNLSSTVTLHIERIFTDSYLQQAWEKCQYIDLFLYSDVHATEMPQLRRLIPAHRILLSAYSDYVRQFVEAYPEPIKFVQQLQTFLKEVAASSNESSVNSRRTSPDRVASIKKAKTDDQQHQPSEEVERELNLKALGMSTLPVLVFPIPLADLHDLANLMYRGQVRVERCRLGSLQQSAHKLKMSPITIAETNQKLIDIIPDASQHSCPESCSCCNHNRDGVVQVDAKSGEQSTVENTSASKIVLQQQRSVDLESIISTSQSSSSFSQDGGSYSGGEADPVSPQVILVEDEVVTEERQRQQPSPTSAIKRSLAAFLRDNNTTPTLSIPKMSKPDIAAIRSAFEKPKLYPPGLSDPFGPSGPFDAHRALMSHTKSFPHHLIQRSHSLNEMEQRLLRVGGHPESPLIGGGPKRKEISPPVPATPSTTMLNPFQFPNGMLPTSLLTPPIDSPTIESQFKTLVTPPPTKLLFGGGGAGAGGGHTNLTPFLFPKHCFENTPTSPFPPQFAFPGSLAAATSAPNGIQRQFSAPANLQQASSSFSSSSGHQPHDLSPLIYDHNAFPGAAAAAAAAELAKSRRGRKPSNYLSTPISEPNSPGIGLFPDGSSGGLFSGPLSDRSESPKSDSHQCGANGWLTTAGSGANCRKRCQNLYHAAKYRDRRRQRMEQLYSEKDALEKAQSIYLSKISTLKVQICSLITQRTQQQARNGTITYRCPVCQAVFFDVEAIRAHLTAEHHEDYQNMTKVAVAAAAAVAASAKSIDHHHPDIAEQIRSLTKDWLARSVASTVRNGGQQQSTNGGPGPGPSSQVGGASTSAIFGNPLATSALNALPMVPFN